MQSIGESYFIREAVREASRVYSPDPMNPEIIATAARKDIGIVARSYLGAIKYKLGDKPFFVEKFHGVTFQQFVASIAAKLKGAQYFDPFNNQCRPFFQGRRTTSSSVTIPTLFT